MLTSWIERLAITLTVDAESDTTTRADMERVSAQLLIEIARADHLVDLEEREAIVTALQQASTLDADELESIVDSALADAAHTVSLHEHIRQINDSFDSQQKQLLIEQMWRVAVADGDIDKYEEYTIRKLSELLFVKHREFIQAKLRVIEAD